ncbi:MAG: hypothetical protein BHW56_02380 [Acetobacter sp. 46_36]|nr:MAG: hypothetical protein BHW56_02380 [Acetobacter sp. 46_36]
MRGTDISAGMWDAERTSVKAFGARNGCQCRYAGRGMDISEGKIRTNGADASEGKVQAECTPAKTKCEAGKPYCDTV